MGSINNTQLLTKISSWATIQINQNVTPDTRITFA